ncbi:MAG: sensor histidine kinase, partial [Candidatus Binatia bacterium]
IPIKVKDKSVGVMNFVSKAPHRFSASEVELVHSIANTVGIAVENASLFKETKDQAVKLERSNKVKDEFLAIMSHELRTPLNVVVGYTGMMRDGLFGEINQEQEKALEKVARQSKELVGLIAGILEATSLEAGAVKVDRQEMNPGSLLEELRATYDTSLVKELTLNWDYPPDIPVLKTDSDKLRHILQNLIDNAIKFTEKGSVTVSAGTLDGARVTGGNGHPAEDNGQVEFRVTDTGPGISKEALAEIFEMFHQGDNSATRPYGGVGLGLYIAKKMTVLLGGKIDVESQPGKGSTFSVCLPFHPEAQKRGGDFEETNTSSGR